MTKLFKITVYFIIAALIVSMPCFCLPAVSASADVRGVWVGTVANLDFPSAQGLSQKQLKSELDSIVSTCKKLKINTVFFQVRPAADSLYKSDIFPWSKVLSGTQGVAPDGNFDPLSYLAERCKKEGVSLQAWINPYRVCKAEELDTLSVDNPARQHPEYTVTCSDGNVYFNPVLEEVRSLVVQGVTEILDNYDVDGIHFDDYFYPYGVTDYPDAEDYKKYGSEFDDIADFRRNNVNILVKEVYDAVHKKKGTVFGISPFGIWDNKRDNPDGSDTTGMSSYSQIYADSRLWVKNGWVDYICPQVYWAFENSAAPFENVVSWWNDLCKDRDVELYIGHAAYKLGGDENGWQSSGQLKRQLELCGKLDGVDGSVFFRYKTLADNILGCADVIKGDKANTEPVKEIAVPETPAVSLKELSVNSPSDGYQTTEENCSLSGVSDPSLPLTVNGSAVQLTDNGYFSVYQPLKVGENTFTFSNGKQTKTVSVIRTEPSITMPDCFYPQSAYPVGECFFSPAQSVTVSVDAIPGVFVYATVAGEDVSLTESELSDVKSTYSADIMMPNTVFDDALFGDVFFYAVKDGVRYDYAESGKITVSNEKKTLYTVNECYIYDSPFGGSMMDNYQLQKGSVVVAVACANSMYKLMSGKWISQDNASEASVKGKIDIDKENYQKITVSSKDVFECYAYVDENGFAQLEFYGVRDAEFDTSDNVNCRYFSNGNIGNAVLNHSDKAITGLFCYRKNETTLDVYVYIKKGVLSGKTIVIDPGHGGSDCGALGPVGEKGATEAQLNLSMSILIANKLASEGAKVYLTRTDDSALPLDERSGIIRDNKPDLSLSVHHNSLGYSSDFNKSDGPIVFYSRETSLPIAKQMAKELDCEYRKQSLSVCRDYRYPCILVECGFVCNPAEYEMLLTDSYKEQLSDKIVLSICGYFNKNS